MSKIKTTNKVSLKLPSRINLGRRGTHPEFATLDTAHKLPRSPERAKEYPPQLFVAAPDRPPPTMKTKISGRLSPQIRLSQTVETVSQFSQTFPKLVALQRYLLKLARLYIQHKNSLFRMLKQKLFGTKFYRQQNFILH